jgi:hypothetical protein
MPNNHHAKPPREDTVISPKFTLRDWKQMRKQLALENADGVLWVKAFDVLSERWHKRYLVPIEWIHSAKGPENSEGEGFAIMTIACCLFESFAAAYSGKLYHYDQAVRLEFDPWAYKDPECCYLQILQKHPQFLMDADLSKRFYRGIRCGLIHESRTKAELRIHCDSQRTEIAWATDCSTIINRYAFVKRLEGAIDQMRSDIKHDKKDFADKSCRLNLARHMDWTFGLFDGHPCQTLNTESKKPWWVKP